MRPYSPGLVLVPCRCVSKEPDTVPISQHHADVSTPEATDVATKMDEDRDEQVTYWTNILLSGRSSTIERLSYLFECVCVHI